MHKHTGREKKSVWTKVFAAALAVSWVLIGVLWAQVYRLSRQNFFSRDIALSDTYYLAQFRDEEPAGEVEWVMGEVQDSAAEAAFWQDAAQDFGWSLEAGESPGELFRSIYQSVDGSRTALSGIRDGLGLTDEEFCFRLSGVPFLDGMEMPNGSEAVCATMLLGHRGISADPALFTREYLPAEPVENRWGIRYGPDPSRAYAGDPFSETGGWGCCAPVIVESVGAYLGPSAEWKALNFSGYDLKDIFSRVVIGWDTPAAVWVTDRMEKADSAFQWHSYDNETTYLCPANQRCMVLVGGDAEHYYFYDPCESSSVVSYPCRQAEESFRALGSQAVAVLPRNAAGSESSAGE